MRFYYLTFVFTHSFNTYILHSIFYNISYYCLTSHFYIIYFTLYILHYIFYLYLYIYLFKKILVYMLQMEYEFPFNEDPMKYYLILS